MAMPSTRTKALLLCLLTAASGACAVKTAPPLPAALKYPEFAYPTATQASASLVATIDRGWRFLQNDDLRNADREFASALKSSPEWSPARTGQGEVALARNDYAAALAAFDAALRTA